MCCSFSSKTREGEGGMKIIHFRYQALVDVSFTDNMKKQTEQGKKRVSKPTEVTNIYNCKLVNHCSNFNLSVITPPPPPPPTLSPFALTISHRS